MLTALFLRAARAGWPPIGHLARYPLVIGTAALGGVAGAAAWQWSWLAAIGVAPVLVSLAPCAAMCGLGLCLHRIGARSCGPPNSQTLAMQADGERVENSTVAQSTMEA